ncbi:MAG: hypothetical protein JSU88_12510 [Nitrospinaceae bacterium]|jgi:hypothetical protein|nr:MAG: hypothetical protein JSU88_12510 [Nitrospinaceae bacterium]
MDFINQEQIWGIILYFIGSGVLTLCSKWELREVEEYRDMRNRYRDNIKKNPFVRSLRARLMTASGFLISLVGAALFFMNIKMD